MTLHQTFCELVAKTFCLGKMTGMEVVNEGETMQKTAFDHFG